MGRAKETKSWGIPYDEERKESLKNVKRKPCERVDCCLSNKLVGKMASCSPFLFVQTLLYKVTYVALSESACVCVHWIVMLCVHCINVTWNTFLCFKNIFLHFECVTTLIVFWAPPQCKLFSLLPEWLQCRYRNRQILQLLLCRQGKSLHPYNLDYLTDDWFTNNIFKNKSKLNNPCFQTQPCLM